MKLSFSNESENTAKNICDTVTLQDIEDGKLIQLNIPLTVFQLTELIETKSPSVSFLITQTQAKRIGTFLLLFATEDLSSAF
jgi:hypothetical protein